MLALPVAILADGVRLAGDLAVPEGAVGVVAFAHGSGSGRHSPRNRQVAEKLLGCIASYKSYLKRFGGSFDDNPTPGNKEGGLTNILEKSLGAAAKAGAGTEQVAGVSMAYVAAAVVRRRRARTRTHHAPTATATPPMTHP